MIAWFVSIFYLIWIMSSTLVIGQNDAAYLSIYFPVGVIWLFLVIRIFINRQRINYLLSTLGKPTSTEEMGVKDGNSQ